MVPSGGINFVDVRDAASATVSAMESGRAGERYLLGGPNWTFREFFARLGRVARMSPPRLAVPEGWGRWARAGAMLIEQVYQQAGRAAPVDAVSVEMSQVYWYCDSSKAQRELSFEARDPTETLDDTVRWLRRHHRI
jgi:dihydroflavonol-4-reductase